MEDFEKEFNQLKSSDCFLGKQVELIELLDSREKKQFIQQECLQKHSCSLLSLSLVSPGGVKKNHLFDYIFQRALVEIDTWFEQNTIEIYSQQIHRENTGHFAVYAVKTKADNLKKLMIDLEESSNLARLWDADVLNEKGEIISRTELGSRPRRCLICEKEAKICARNRTHTLEDILITMQKLVLEDAFANMIMNLAAKALEKEVLLTPKPGLVDKRNNGSHKDMDLPMFHRSIQAIKPYLKDFVSKGMALQNEEKDKILEQIRPIGIEAEKKMFQTTQGVNTHKGSIFSLGLVCTALGYLYKKESVSITEVCKLVSEITQNIEKELEVNEESTAGIKTYKKYKFKGARGEAASGFQTVVSISLPIFEKFNFLGEDFSLFLALISLMSENNDTNIVNRGGVEALQWIKDYAGKMMRDSKIYENEKYFLQQLEEFDDECINRNLSPGGSADLLSLTWFFYYIKKLQSFK